MEKVEFFVVLRDEIEQQDVMSFCGLAMEDELCVWNSNFFTGRVEVCSHSF